MIQVHVSAKTLATKFAAQARLLRVWNGIFAAED
jgi:hypothetical protein